MLATTTTSCEIFHAGRIIDPEEAISFGRAAMAQYTECYRLFGWDRRLAIDYSAYPVKTELKQDPNDPIGGILALSEDHRAVLSKAELALKGMCAERAVDVNFEIGSDIHIGTPKQRGRRPHVDDLKIFRLITNLSPDTLTLLVANSWQDADFTKDPTPIFRPNRPIDYTQIQYEPGEGIFIDNMFGDDPFKQVPHGGEDATGKVILRTDYVRL